MNDQTIRYVPAREIPGSTPGQPGGIVAVVVDDLGQEHSLSAAAYHAQEHSKIRALELWKEVRFLTPIEIHPEDFRKLYPEYKTLGDNQIREKLARVIKFLRIGS